MKAHAVRSRSLGHESIAVITPVIVVVLDYLEISGHCPGILGVAYEHFEFLHYVRTGYRGHQREKLYGVFRAGGHRDCGAEHPGVMGRVLIAQDESVLVSRHTVERRIAAAERSGRPVVGLIAGRRCHHPALGQLRPVVRSTFEILIEESVDGDYPCGSTRSLYLLHRNESFGIGFTSDGIGGKRAADA